MTNYSKLHLWMAVFVLSAVPFLAAQETAEREQLAIFDLSGQERAGFPEISEDRYTRFHQSLRRVFRELGRLSVAVDTYRLEEDSVEDLADGLREYQEDSETSDESVEAPEEAPDDASGYLGSLTGSDYLAVPVLSDFTTDSGDEDAFTVEVTVEFSFIDTGMSRVFERFPVTAAGSGESAAAAAAAALVRVPEELTRRLLRVPEFDALSGVIDFVGRQVVLDIGREAGAAVGDEFTIGDTATGLIYLSEVREEYSFGYTLYADPPPQLGDQLRKKWSLPFDIELFSGLQGLTMPTAEVPLPESIATAGIQLTGSRGFYPVRPMVRVGVPLLFTNSSYQDTPQGDYYGVEAAVGGEYMTVIGRARLAPFVLFGVIGGSYSAATTGVETGAETEDASLLSHLGVTGGLRVGWHLSRHLVVYLSPGLSAYVGIDGLASLLGPSLTLGVNVK